MRFLVCAAPAVLLAILSSSRGAISVQSAPARFETLRDAAEAASSSDERVASAAAKHLRSHGEAGLRAMQAIHGASVSELLGEGPPTGAGPEELRRIAAAFNVVSGQHDGWASGLYWHKDLHAAQAAARESGKPILNLWLLGRLDDEFC
jgi:hypothetical protein